MAVVFSHPEKVKYGASRYQWQRNDLSAILNDLFTTYNLDGVTMPYTIEDYKKESNELFLKRLPPDERLKLFLPKDSLKKYPLPEISKSVQIMFPELGLKEIEDILEKMMKET